MKTLINTLFLVLLWAGSAGAFPQGFVAGMGGVGAAAPNGLIGNKSAPDSYVSGNSDWTVWGNFTTIDPGQVAYAYFDPGSTSYLNMSLTKVVVYSSDGSSVLAETTCSWTNVSGTLYRAELAAPLTLSGSTQYSIGITTGDFDWQVWGETNAAGVYHDTTTYGFASVCPETVQSSVTEDATDSTTHSMSIWLSNIDNDTH